MITQQNMMFMMQCLQRCYGIHPNDEQLGFLPLAHIAGRMFYTFSLIESRAVINLVESQETVVRDLQEVEPTIHFAVPRVWEKQFSTVAIKLKEATWLGRVAYDTGLKIGQKRAAYLKR